MICQNGIIEGSIRVIPLITVPVLIAKIYIAIIWFKIAGRSGGFAKTYLFSVKIESWVV